MGGCSNKFFNCLTNLYKLRTNFGLPLQRPYFFFRHANDRFNILYAAFISCLVFKAQRWIVEKIIFLFGIGTSVPTVIDPLYITSYVGINVEA